MTKSTDDWLGSQLAWQRSGKAHAVASPKIRRYWKSRMASATPSAPGLFGSKTGTAKSDGKSNTALSRRPTGKGG